MNQVESFHFLLFIIQQFFILVQNYSLSNIFSSELYEFGFFIVPGLALVQISFFMNFFVNCWWKIFDKYDYFLVFVLNLSYFNQLNLSGFNRGKNEL